MANERRQAELELSNGDRERFRRPRQRVEVRRRAGWKRGLVWAGWALLVAVTLGLAGGGGWLVYGFATGAEVFRVESVETIAVAEAKHATPAAVRDRFTEDVGRSVWSVPLEERRHALEEIPWVEAATVQRVLPNRLRVFLRERTPVAFLRQGKSLWLIDAYGVVLPVPPGESYSFPVLTGMGSKLSPAEWQERVELYRKFVQEMDRDGRNFSAEFSEVDVGDREDVCATVAVADGAVRLHFGRGRYQEKYQTFLEHRDLLFKSGTTVRSVDLRYRGQIVLNPDGRR